MTTGERIKLCRKRLSLSAEKLASIISVSPATIYRWEKGDIEKVPGSVLEPLADALQTTPEYLAGWGQDQPDKKNDPQKIEPSPQLPGAVKLLSLAHAYPDMSPEARAYVDGSLDLLFKLLEDQFKKGSSADDPKL